MITHLFALSAHAAPGFAEVIEPVGFGGNFGIGKAFAVLVVVFVVLLGAMYLGGHLGEASRRRKDKRKDKRH